MLLERKLCHLQDLRGKLFAVACLFVICCQSAAAENWRQKHVPEVEAQQQQGRTSNRKEMTTIATGFADIFKANEDHLHLVVVFKQHVVHQAWLRRLCNASNDDGKQHDTVSSSSRRSSSSSSKGLPHCAPLVGVCRHLYKTSITGAVAAYNCHRAMNKTPDGKHERDSIVDH